MLHILKNMVHAGYWLNFQVKGRAGLDKAELDTLLSKLQNMKHRPKGWQ